MKKKDELSPQQADKVLKVLDDVLNHKQWAESNFLKSIEKNIKKIRDDFAGKIGGEAVKAASSTAGVKALRAGQQEVYISVYSSDGSNLRAWERILSNLPNQIISRPIYEVENDVIAAIKMKENKINEAYVSIFVNQSDILTVPSDKIPQDKLGKPLLTLKQKILDLENVNRFVHQSGTYQYNQGFLSKKPT